jgi:glycosyltransferase involved in cell wall biosynthesis
MPPLLSICIPTFNREKELSRLLTSIIPQCIGQSVEIIVSDNASDDGTQTLCKKYAGLYHWLHYQRQSNNIGYALNLVSVLGAARGQFLWMLGDDELVHDEAVKCIATTLSNQRPNLLICNLSRLNSRDDDWAMNREFDTDYDLNGLSLNGLLTITSGWVSLLSISIVKADRYKYWLNSNATIAYSDYVGLDITLCSGAQGKCSIISEPLVGRMKQPFLANRFNQIETYAFDFIRPLNQMVKNKALSSKIRNSIMTQMYFGMLGFKLIHRKTSGGALPPLQEWISEHARVPMFWGFIFPLLVLPRQLIHLVVIMIRYVARWILGDNSSIRRLLEGLP